VHAGWIEATTGKFGFYAEGNGPAVARVMDAIDAERLALARALGVRAVPFTELFRQLGFTTGGQGRAGGADHVIQHSELIRPIQSPPSSTTATCTKTSAGAWSPGCTWPRRPAARRPRSPPSPTWPARSMASTTHAKGSPRSAWD
jgi:hypothetical protein